MVKYNEFITKFYIPKKYVSLKQYELLIEEGFNNSDIAYLYRRQLLY